MSKWEVTLEFESHGEKSRPTVAEKNAIRDAIEELVQRKTLDVHSCTFKSMLPQEYVDDPDYEEPDDA